MDVKKERLLSQALDNSWDCDITLNTRPITAHDYRFRGQYLGKSKDKYGKDSTYLFKDRDGIYSLYSVAFTINEIYTE